ncbi:MAG: hypothetical protein U0228_08990 [Myxococcaceae bacterium]
MLFEFLAMVQRWGRVGGAVLLTLGLASGGFGAWLFTQVSPDGERELKVLVFALVCCGLGLFLGMQGLLLLVRGGTTKPRLSDDQLREVLSAARPVLVCLDCRLVVDVAPCSNCSQSSSVLEVRSETDRENARALLGLDRKVG